MRWRWTGRLAGAILLVLAGVILLLQTRVGGGRFTCGSAWDVVSGRVSWRQWWSWDQLEPASAGPLLRTLRCPDAVDGRMWWAGGLLAAALIVVAITELLARSQPGLKAPSVMRRSRLRAVATACAVTGMILTLAGLAGIALLTANPNDPLFLYTTRPVVVLAGLLLLTPSVLIVVVGLLTRAATQSAADGSSGDDTS